MPGLWNRGKTLYKKAKGFGANAYAEASEFARGVDKVATAARKGYDKANQLGLIDRYGGQHAGDIKRTAQRGFSTYDQLSRAATQADSDFRAMRA